MTAKEILIDGAVGAPGTAGELDRTLEKCSPTGGQPFGGLSATKERPSESGVAFT